MLDSETILAATEGVLRRYGPAKATVVDVARALDVSHAAVYRHFPSKTALREAVIRRWITGGRDDVARIVEDTRQAPPERMRAWILALFASKRARLREDPELFATYRLLVADHSGVAAEHVADLLGQIRRIYEDGVASGHFAAGDAEKSARAVFEATSWYHNPFYVGGWLAEDADANLGILCDLLLNGLRTR